MILSFAIRYFATDRDLPKRDALNGDNIARCAADKKRFYNRTTAVLQDCVVFGLFLPRIAALPGTHLCVGFYWLFLLLHIIPRDTLLHCVKVVEIDISAWLSF